MHLQVTQVVTQVEKQVGQQHGSQDHNVLVLQVLEELRPVIIQLIAEQAKLHEQSAVAEVTHTVTGGATHVTGDEFNSLEDEYRKGLELMRSDSFATAIESRVRPAVDVELRSIFEQYSSHGDEEARSNTFSSSSGQGTTCMLIVVVHHIPDR